MAENKRAKGDGSVFQRKSDGMYVGSVEVYTVDGKRRQKRVYGKTEGVALAKLQKVRNELARGMVPTATNTKVGQWLQHWLKNIHTGIRPKTREFYEESIRLHIIPAIGGRRLDRLSPEDVRAMLRSIKTGRNRQRAHLVLRLALKAAVTDGSLARNVTDAVPKPEHLAKRRGAFTFADAIHILRTAVAVDEARAEGEPALATRWQTAFLTAARPGEALGLTLDRLNLEEALFDFSWQLQQLDRVHGCGEPVDDKYPCGRTRPGWCPQAHWDFNDDFEYHECHRSLVWTRPKTAAGTRVVPIVPALVDRLRDYVGRTVSGPLPPWTPGAVPVKEHLVWRYPDGRPIRPKDDHTRWHQLLKAAGLPPAAPYSARHSTATMLQELGVSEEVRMQIMGQSSAAAHRGYVHVDQTQTRAALAKLSGRLTI